MIVIAAIPFVQFLLIVASRLTYPFDIEWMEGALLGHAIEFVDTGRIYKLPSQDFVPFIYPPLYTYLVAFGIRLFGIGYTCARLVSVLSAVGAAFLAAGIVRRETGDRLFAVLAFLGPFAMYGVTGYWLDLVRVDSVALLLAVGGVFSLLYATGRRGAHLVLCAVLLALAGFGKQSFLLFAAVVAVWLAFRRDWRGLLVYAIAAAIAHALLWGGLFAAEGRIAFTYILEVPRTQGGWKKSFWDALSLAVHNLYVFRPILVPLAVSVFLAAWGMAGPKKARLGLLALFSLAAVVISLLTRAKYGGYENAYIPAYFFLGLLSFCGAGTVLRRHRSAAAVAGDPEGSRNTVGTGRAFRLLFLMLVLVSSLTGALRIDVGAQRVTGERREAVRRLKALVEAVDGRVLIPSANAAAITGRPSDNHYHAMAARDIFRCPDLYRAFREDDERGLEEKRFAVILMEVMSGNLESRYGYRRLTVDDLGIPSRFLASITGKENRLTYLYYAPGVDIGRIARTAASAREHR